jgi:hypothetical protein
MKRSIAWVVALVGSLGLAGATAADIARGDAAYAQRGASALGDRAAPEAIRAAVAAYEAALAAAPDSLEARWKLLRALYFEGDFATPDPDAKKALFERATALAEQSIERFQARAGDDLAGLDDAALRARLAAAGISTTDAAALQFWSAVAWGVWSRSHGLLDAVRRGVAERIYEQARLANRLQPALEQGGPLRLLARLHAKLPRVPLISGFVDRSQAEPLAEETLRRWPEHPGNRLLVALTWLELDPARRAEALSLLGEVAAVSPRPSQRVEDAAVVSAAQERLSREQATGG